jgi:hypothetical protein
MDNSEKNLKIKENLNTGESLPDQQIEKKYDFNDLKTAMNIIDNKYCFDCGK